MVNHIQRGVEGKWLQLLVTATPVEVPYCCLRKCLQILNKIPVDTVK